MADLVVDGSDLVVTLSPLEKVGALHGEVRVPLASVVSTTVLDQPMRQARELLRGSVRAPGTAVPGVLALGTWRGRSVRQFVAVTRGRRALAVELRDAPYQRLIVGADDPHAVAAAIGR